MILDPKLISCPFCHTLTLKKCSTGPIKGGDFVRIQWQCKNCKCVLRRDLAAKTLDEY